MEGKVQRWHIGLLKSRAGHKAGHMCSTSKGFDTILPVWMLSEYDFSHHKQVNVNWFKTRLNVASSTSVTKTILRVSQKQRPCLKWIAGLFPWPQFLDWDSEFWHGRLCYQDLSNSVTASLWSWQCYWKCGNLSRDTEVVHGHEQIITALRKEWLLFLSLKNVSK